MDPTATLPQIETTTTTTEEMLSPSLGDANAALRRAVAERHARQAVAPPNAAHAATDVEPAECCGGSRMHCETPRLHPASLAFMELLDELRQLHISKSQDYGSRSDPLANIRQGAEFVSIESWRGCMVRIADKVQRLRTYCRTGRLVHEGVRDTLLDLAAYSLLGIVLFDEGARCQGGTFSE